MKIDNIDATHHSSADEHRHGRPDAAARMKRAHEAAAYDAWFRAQVDAGIKEADDPSTQWVSHEDSMARMYKHLEELEVRARSKN